MANDRRRSKPGNGEGSHAGPGARNGRPNGTKRLVEPVASLDRREFVKVAGLTIPLASFLEACSLDSDGAPNAESNIHIEGDLPIDFSLSAVRRDDFLLLRFDFINLEPDRHHKFLEPKRRHQPSIILLNFQPQSIFEASFFEGFPDTTPNAPLPIESVISGPSRLAFLVPNGVRRIPMSLEGILDLVQRLDPHVSLNALPAGERSVIVPVPGPIGPPHPPGHGPWHATRWLRRARHHYARRFFHRPPPPPPETEVIQAGIPRLPFNHETALEVPFRLIVSPNRHGAWAHASEPVTSRQSHRTELWHTRLGIRGPDGSVDERDPTNRTIRALWTRDAGFDPNDPPGLGDDPPEPNEDPVSTSSSPFVDPNVIEPLTGSMRARIVHLTSNFEDLQDIGDVIRPTPIDVNLLMLSSVGNWLDSKVKFEGPSFGLASWEHRSTMGRDHYDKVVFKGFLFPFGHRAELIRITERKFKPNHPHVAYLRTRYFIVVREPQKDYAPGRTVSADPHDPIVQSLRRLPFDTIVIDTLVTPNLDVANVDQDGNRSFVPRFGGNRAGGGFTGGEAFRFDMRGLDVEGNIIRFTAPVVWVPVEQDPADINDPNAEKLPETDLNGLPLAIQLYASNAGDRPLTDDEKVVTLQGQRPAYGEAIKPDDTSFETESVVFGFVTSDGPGDPGESLGTNEELLTVTLGFPLFIPRIDNARIAVDALRHVAGEDRATFDFEYHPAYVADGFGAGDRASGHPNAGDLLLKVNQQFVSEVNYNQKSDKSGGFLTPNLQPAGLARSVGLISAQRLAALGPTDPVLFNDVSAALGAFDPQQFMGFLDGALLFGVFKLGDLLKGGELIDPAQMLSLDSAPKYLTQIVSGALGAFADAERLLNDLQNLPDTFDAAVQPVIDAIEAFAEDVNGALELEGDARQAALSEILGDIEAVATALQGLADDLASLGAATQLPTALLEDLTRRAAAVASALQTNGALIVQQLTDLALLAEFPKEIRTSLSWRATVRNFVVGINDHGVGFVPLSLDPNDLVDGRRRPVNESQSLLLTADIRARTDALVPPEVSLSCSLEHFRLDLFSSGGQANNNDPFQFIRLTFGRFVFKIENLKKPDILVDFDPSDGIEFVGPLKFIQNIKDAIPLDAFSDPPSIEVDSSGLTAGISLAIPNLAIGAFSLENILLAASVKIPFLGRSMSFQFGFSTRENPFGLTIILLGGGGYFMIEIDCAGVITLEASLEAAARISVDFAVLSAMVEVALGIIFRWVKADTGPDNLIEVTGFYRVRGQVDVLGLITASITCTLEMIYNITENILAGRATIEIEIDILFFSATVTLTVEKELPGAFTNALPFSQFGGNGGGRRIATGDTPFIEVMGPAGNLRPWNDYLDAFAA